MAMEPALARVAMPVEKVERTPPLLPDWKKPMGRACR